MDFFRGRDERSDLHFVEKDTKRDLSSFSQAGGLIQSAQNSRGTRESRTARLTQGALHIQNTQEVVAKAEQRSERSCKEIDILPRSSTYTNELAGARLERNWERRRFSPRRGDGRRRRWKECQGIQEACYVAVLFRKQCVNKHSGIDALHRKWKGGRATHQASHGELTRPLSQPPWHLLMT